MSAFSDKQREVLTAVHEMLAEHFDCALVAVSAECEEDGKLVAATKLAWSGGYLQAVGLAEEARDRLRENRTNEAVP